MVTSPSDESSILDSTLGACIQGHRRKERFHLNHPYFIFMTSEHEHGHTSTSEDDLLKLLKLLEHTQTWTRVDKRAKSYRTTSSLGSLWENVVARITIEDNIGHIMSLEYTKHMNEKAHLLHQISS